jgi:HD-like signal output (HDOD) protein
VEYERLGATHADIGSHVINLWGLPRPIVEAVHFHHRPMDRQASGFDHVTAVYVANALTRKTADSGLLTEVDCDYLRHVNIYGRLAEWRRLAA